MPCFSLTRNTLEEGPKKISATKVKNVDDDTNNNDDDADDADYADYASSLLELSA